MRYQAAMPDTSPEAPHPLLRALPWIDLLAKALTVIAASLAIWHQLG